MADRKKGVRGPEPTETVRSEDWQGRDIDGTSFSRTAFVDVDLTEVQSRGAVFDECTFSGCAFNCSLHVDSAFTNCTFNRCTFFEASFTRCKLVGSVFDRCTFKLLRVVGGDWSFVGLPGADLRGVTVDGARLREADLTGARFEDAVLRDVDLSGAWLHSADFTGCDLRGSDLSAFDPLTMTLARAVITWEQASVLAGGLGLDVRPE